MSAEWLEYSRRAYLCCGVNIPVDEPVEGDHKIEVRLAALREAYVTDLVDIWTLEDLVERVLKGEAFEDLVLEHEGYVQTDDGVWVLGSPVDGYRDVDVSYEDRMAWLRARAVDERVTGPQSAAALGQILKETWDAPAEW